MKNNTVILLLAAIIAPAAQATTISYDLKLSSDDINHISGTGYQFDLIPNGTTYATVTMDDNDDPSGVIDFTVALSDYWTGICGNNCGFDSFGFNTSGLGGIEDVINLPLIEWDTTIATNGTAQDGFGKFDVVVRTNGAANRVAPELTFSIDNSTNILDIFSDYVDGSTNSANGSTFFAAHIAGFSDVNLDSPGVDCVYDADGPSVECNELVSIWVGSDGTVSVVPVPAAVWLFGSGLLGLIGVARRKKA